MTAVIVAIVVIGVIVAVGMLNGIDGVLAMTGLSAIGGLLGWQGKKAKEDSSIGSDRIPVTESIGETSAVAVTVQPVPRHAPKVARTGRIDYDAITKEVGEYIKSHNWIMSASTIYSVAHSRAVALRIRDLDEAIAGTNWLMGLASDAFLESYGFLPAASVAGVKAQVAEYVSGQCQSQTTHQDVVESWVIRLIQHLEGLERLRTCGVDWQKVANTHKSVWMIGELAMNPAVDISPSS